MPDSKPTIPECEVCHGAEWTEVVIKGETFMQPCHVCHARRQAPRLQKICGLNDQERQVSLLSVSPNGAATTTMVNAAQDFIAQPRAMLMLHGTCGNAKTLVLQAIVNAMLAAGVGAIYATFYDLVQWVREAYADKDNESAWQRIGKLQKIRVLCIDELDKVKQTEWVAETETQLLDARYRDGLAGRCGTVLAMNGGLDQLSCHLQSRLQDGRNRIILNNDPDMRKVMR